MQICNAALSLSKFLGWLPFDVNICELIKNFTVVACFDTERKSNLKLLIQERNNETVITVINILNKQSEYSRQDNRKLSIVNPIITKKSALNSVYASFYCKLK